jgi:hypothetical protein
MKTGLVFAGGFVAGFVFLFMLELAAFVSQQRQSAAAIDAFNATAQQVVASSLADSQRYRAQTLDRQLQAQRERDARRRPGDVCVNRTLVRRSVVNGVPTVQQDMANSDLCK